MLISYGSELGLAFESDTPRGELLRLVRQRQELLLDIDRDALLDVVVWARQPVRKSASKESLARQIAKITNMRFDGLSDRGLRALARLRGVEAGRGRLRSQVERELKQQENFSSKIRRMRRSVMGSLVSHWLERRREDEAYRFLPENDTQPSLKESIRSQGVVGGIANRLRGVADEYIEAKLDEIEKRIDRKLDEIDERLAEWRDREIQNRMRIVKITLITAIIVAILSLGYDYALSLTRASGEGNVGKATLAHKEHQS